MLFPRLIPPSLSSNPPSHHQAQHVVDPIPIKQTVRNTFGEFWRTHQDTWPMLKEKFTEDQLSALTNLLASPSYFS